jgi:hypothetical protein
MPKYENHSTDYQSIHKAITDYEGGSKSQQQCCDDNGIKLSVFRYYYRNRKVVAKIRLPPGYRLPDPDDEPKPKAGKRDKKGHIKVDYKQYLTVHKPVI